MRMMPRALLAQAAADAAFAPAFLAMSAELSARAAAHWRLGDGLRRALVAMPVAAPDADPLARTLAEADALSMLHALQVADGIDATAHVSATAAARRRDTRLLVVLRGMDADPVDG
jgi:hypothetical protein